MKILQHTLFILTGLALILSSCGNDNISINEEELGVEFEESKLTQITEEEKIVLNEIMQSIPSPLEVSSLVKESGAGFNINHLNEPDNSSKYISSHDRALNLGVFGADLAYCNIYGENTSGIPFLGAIKDLSEQLKIGNFFDNATLLKLMKNDDSMDSLLVITTSNFEKINHHLQENQQSQIGALMLTGGWIEGLHLLLEVHQSSPKNIIKERIGEQKIVLEQLLHILSYYKEDQNILSLSKHLNELNEVFKTVEIKRIEGAETETRIVNGVIQVYDSSSTNVIISDEQIKQIKDKLSPLRNKII